MFECGGAVPGDAGIADCEVRPLAFEAIAIAGNPSPGRSRASGGRCCPHSFNPNIRPGAAFNVAAKRSGLAARLVDEAANAHVHHQTNRQENKQRGRAPVAHQRQRDAGNRHIADHHGHIHQNMEAKRCCHAHH